MPKDLAVINWIVALEQVGGDRDFLDEVLRDLFTEADGAIEKIRSGIAEKNFDAVMKAAHQIKGSASYLHCEILRDISLQLQDAGQAGLRGPEKPDKLWQQIREMFDDFQMAITELKAAVSNGK